MYKVIKMPISYNRGNFAQMRKIAFRSRGRSAQSLDAGGGGGGGGAARAEDQRQFLQIRPALADPRQALAQRSHTTLSGNECVKDDGKEDLVNLQAVGEGKVQLSRTPQEKDRLPDRISLDRRGLSSIPHIVGEPGLRLLSLQHNLINSLAGLAPLDLGKLVFLDLYDNQIDKITCLERLFTLRVLLVGKNRIRRIEGLSNLNKLEVLDLHGNRIGKVCGLSNLSELKVLNLAGNQIKCVGQSDLQGLVSLRELNLKRNRLRKLLGFQHTPRLQKLYLGNNDLQSVEDVSSLAEAVSLVDISLDGNPVALGGDCIPFLVSYLPNLMTLTNMHVTEQVRAAARAWRSTKEAARAAYCALGDAEEARRDQVISNARTNWELLRSENKCFTNNTTSLSPVVKNLETEKESPSEVVISPKTAGDNPEESESSPRGAKEAGGGTEAAAAEAEGAAGGAARRLQRSASTARRVNFSERSASQDTDASHSTSTSSELRLPPILLPIISSLEGVKLADGAEPLLKRWESISSVEPVVDSSFSSLPSSSESEEERGKRPPRRAPTAFRRRETFGSARSKSVCDPESGRAKARHSDLSENNSTISGCTNVASAATSSTSGSEARALRREASVGARPRPVRSATTRRERAASASRAPPRSRSGKSLASFKSSEPVPVPVPKPMPPSKDREQGVDYLVEVCEGVVSAWGAGALRRLARDWDWERARGVRAAAFHYVHFTAVAAAFGELKARFPNVTHISVRATGLASLGQLHALAELRGLTGLRVLPEGNPICGKQWRPYAVYRLAHWGLRLIDDQPVTEEEIKEANETYAGLSELVVRALPEAPLAPLVARLGRGGGAREWLRAAEPALRDVVAKEALQWRRGGADEGWRARGRESLARAVALAVGAALRLRALDLHWPALLVDMIEDILRDFADMDRHVKEQLQALADSL